VFCPDLKAIILVQMSHVTTWEAQAASAPIGDPQTRNTAQKTSHEMVFPSKIFRIWSRMFYNGGTGGKGGRMRTGQGGGKVRTGRVKRETGLTSIREECWGRS